MLANNIFDNGMMRVIQPVYNTGYFEERRYCIVWYWSTFLWYIELLQITTEVRQSP